MVRPVLTVPLSTTNHNNNHTTRTPTRASSNSSNVENSSPRTAGDIIATVLKSSSSSSSSGLENGGHHNLHLHHHLPTTTKKSNRLTVNSNNNNNNYGLIVEPNHLNNNQSFFRVNPESSSSLPTTMTTPSTGRTAATSTAEPLHQHDSSSATPAPVVRQTISGSSTSIINEYYLQQQQQHYHATTITSPPLAATTINIAASPSTITMLERGGVLSTSRSTNNNKEVISSGTSPSSATGGIRQAMHQHQQQQQLYLQQPVVAAQATVASSLPLLIPPPLQPSQPPLRERRDSHSVVSQTSLPGDAWQWQENNDPDDQEQALFEQRLCEDIYGVAVRKINQNGKSNLRYVKCCWVDASELLDQQHHASSNRSISSRSWSSRNGFSRLMNGGTSSSNNSFADPRDYDAHTTLIPGKKIRVLSWGKKKDVRIPVDKFVAVRKGKTTERTKRNPCPPSRILSLVTADEDSNSSPHGVTTTTLDIEAPTKLDRDKFARAFSRFLNVPLIEAEHPIIQQQPLTGGGDMRSVRSDMTPQSYKDPRHPSSSQQLTANSSVPDIAATNSYTTNGSSRKHVPLPVVTTSITDSGKPPSKPSSRMFKSTRKSANNSQDRSITSSNHNNGNTFPGGSSNRSNQNSFENSDPQLMSLPSSSNIPIGVFHNHEIHGDRSKSGHDDDNDDNGLHQAVTNAAAAAATLEIPFGPKATPAASSSSSAQHHSTPAAQEDAGSVVSSITGGGFDQDLVEELHLALEKMRAELDESRAEAARAVKVAEQAIQSAENSSSKDWNSTVTHKAAEAAAAAQKKSAEALAKARVAEEKLENEKKNALIWKKQLESAEEQAGHWQTRAVAAEVQRFAVAEALDSERKKNARLLAGTINTGSSTLRDPFDPFENSFRDGQSDDLEVDRLRSKLAMESARRRKLLDELQDLRGSVRVYCRPYSSTPVDLSSTKSTISMPSSDVLLLIRPGSSLIGTGGNSLTSSVPPLSFEFDGILPSDTDQHDVYAEFESICSSVLEGFKICVMTYGQSDAGKTYTMLGQVQHKSDHSVTISDYGIHLRAMKQLFSVLEHRQDRYNDVVTMNLIEVHDERLVDLLAGTDFGEANGKVEGTRRSGSKNMDNRPEDGNGSMQANSVSSSRPKLEIRTNRDGETVVHGVLSVNVSSFEDVYKIWTQSLAARSKRLSELDVDPRTYELDSHVIATLKIVAMNIATGIVTSGKMQFVDFASSDVITKRSLKTNQIEDWKFTNKSLNTVRDVVRARSQYQRSVPYRNSTITHMLSDSLEGDTKVVLVACVSPDEKDSDNTTCTLRFAQEMRKVVIGKATRHTSSSASP